MIEQLAALGIGVGLLCIFFVIVWALSAIVDWFAARGKPACSCPRPWPLSLVSAPMIGYVLARLAVVVFAAAVPWLVYCIRERWA